MPGYPPIDSKTPEELASFFNLPAQPPPDNVIPLAPNTPNNNGVALGVTVACAILTTTGVILRAYSQIFVKKRVTVEDGLGALAFTAFCGTLWTTLELLKYRMFYNHLWDISIRHFSDILFALYIWPSLYCLVMGFIKSAILLDWIKIFVPKGTRNKFWWTCVVLLVFNACVYLAFFMAVQFYCTPHERIWRRWVPGTCLDRKSIDFPSSVFNLILDILILLLPQRVIWHLKLTKSKRISISVVFGIGILAVVAAAGRVYSMSMLNYDNDITYSAGPAYLWSLGEITCVILVFCIPPIPRIFASNRDLNTRKSSSRKSSSRSITIPAFRASRGSIGSRNIDPRWPDERGFNDGFLNGRNVIEGGTPSEIESQIQLANLVALTYPSSNNIPTGRTGGSKILCTTTFTAEAHYAPNKPRVEYRSVGSLGLHFGDSLRSDGGITS